MDPWGNPLRYFLEGSRNCRVSSDGPDGITKTRWDIGITLTVTAPEKEKVKTWHDALHPEESWLDRRKAELGMKVEQTKGDLVACLLRDQPRLVAPLVAE